ncbi:MAG: bifunctional methylenetetrahydrofolate dehydrogenase/methenyltetrahydrofolate cyclohydrolase FolD [Clostridia bacterium]|nr:bifunctional methylenetetrahydrofolate dehydrogenase/methenyltetrahydrofolate cyclohydrolase FolD [Clostridia bacterium]MCI8979404.1 bifunctional methylenetetrahydrofolate dehydrogenase/methenyltetrahydrofolate cyclohydrolase FolD [Clostridia bacterium]MCI9086259.1 bifunctional methylenetetrahydrofolate dehydrogenase/methenyltetrahydrofolate cyclohydrolase FolD [Clostridia bacterium]NDO19291.1 bifunctional methylenetetrahydrofolate dehydrogenase/methenyltetrahydrofolate cyclohydrolase FolD [L
MAQLLKGKEVSARIKSELKTEVEKLKEKGICPGLAVIIVGDDPASQVYVRNKERACEECGIYSEKYELSAKTSKEELLSLIETLNKKNSISGILVQLPIPKHIDEETIINAIAPQKDVDAFHPVNVGKIMVGNYDFVPCTPAGVMELIKESGIDVSGKECVIVGRSNIVGKPQAMLLLHQNGTVTICHSKTKNLEEKTKQADILVAAVGIPNFIKGNMIKEGAVVIDVGINRMDNGKLCGDVEFETAEKAAGAITPVPGGVGPMTIAMLMKNTVKAAILNKTQQ